MIFLEVYHLDAPRICLCLVFTMENPFKYIKIRLPTDLPSSE